MTTRIIIEGGPEALLIIDGLTAAAAAEERSRRGDRELAAQWRVLADAVAEGLAAIVTGSGDREDERAPESTVEATP